MADPRPFRFRLPWLSTAPAPRPTAEPQPPRPTVEIQAPARPIVAIPTQRPPFRPPGIAPAQPPPPAQAPQRTDPQPPSPPRATTEPQQAMQPTSPSLVTTQTSSSSVPPSPSRGVSQPASPLLGTTRTRAAFQTESPSRAGPQSRGASVPPSPSRIAAQSQAAVKTSPQTQSPSRLASQRAGQTSSRTFSPPKSPIQPQTTASQLPSPSKTLQATTQATTQTALSASQQEERMPPVSLPPQQVRQLKTEITSVRASESEKEHLLVSGPLTAVAPTSASTLEATATAQKSDADIPGDNRQTLRTEPGKGMKEIEEGKRFMQEQQIKGKTNSSAHEESMTSTKTKLLAASSGSGTLAKEPHNSAFHDEQKKHVKENTSEGTITFSSNGEKIKAVSLYHPKARGKVSEVQHRSSMSNEEQVPLQKEIKEDISKLVNKLGVGQAKLPIGGQPVSILTLAGENRGATMHIGSESGKKDGSIHIQRGYGTNPDESTEATTDADRSSKKRHKDPLTKEDQKTRAFINSNTQSINSSILYQASVDERNPGVNLILAHDLAEPTKHSTHAEPVERKTEFNVTPSEKLTYEPTVRTRGLRGLFLESSDSDTNYPEKPRRHG